MGTNAIQKATAAYFKISLETLRTNNSRNPIVVTARHVARYLERQTARSFPAIAVDYNCDHSTVYASVRHIAERLEANDVRYVEPVRDIAAVVKYAAQQEEKTEAIKMADAMACPTCGAPVIKELQRQIALLSERVNELSQKHSNGVVKNA